MKLTTNSCIELFLLLYARNNFFYEYHLNKFNNICKEIITQEMLAGYQFYLTCSLNTHKVAYFKKVNL